MNDSVLYHCFTSHDIMWKWLYEDLYLCFILQWEGTLHPITWTNLERRTTAIKWNKITLCTAYITVSDVMWKAYQAVYLWGSVCCLTKPECSDNCIPQGLIGQLRHKGKHLPFSDKSMATFKNPKGHLTIFIFFQNTQRPSGSKNITSAAQYIVFLTHLTCPKLLLCFFIQAKRHISHPAYFIQNKQKDHFCLPSFVGLGNTLESQQGKQAKHFFIVHQTEYFLPR